MRNDEILCCSRLGSLVDSTCRPWQIMVSSSRSSSSFRCGRNAWNKNEQTTSWRICQICSSKSIKSSIQWMCFQTHILQTFKEASASVWLSPWRPHAAMDSPSACASHRGEWGKRSIPALWQVTQVTNKKLPPAASSYAANFSPSKRLSFWPRQQLQEQHKSQTSSEAAAKKTKKKKVFQSFGLSNVFVVRVLLDLSAPYLPWSWNWLKQSTSSNTRLNAGVIGSVKLKWTETPHAISKNTNCQYWCR